MAVLKALPGAPDFKALPGSAKINGEPIKDNQPIKGKLISIKKSVINIGKFLDRKKKQTEKQNEEFRKRDQNFKRRKKEEKLEEPKKEWKKLVPKKIPGLSFFDSIKKFVSGWILGFIAIKLIPLLPKLIPAVLALGKIVNWFIDLGGKFLNGFISFIDFGMKAQAATLGFMRNLGGEKFANAFERFMKFFGGALDLMLIVGALSLEEALTGGGGLDGLGDLLNPKKLKNLGKSALTKGGKLVKGSWGLVKTAGAGLKAIAPALGWIAAAGLLATAIGEGGAQILKWGKHLEKNALVASKKAKDTPWWNPMKYWHMLTSAVLGFTNRMSGFTFGLFDILGTPFRLIIEGLRWPFMNQEQRDAAALNLEKFDARIREQFRGFFNMFDFLGVVPDKPGSWGNIEWSKKGSGTDEMGYTEDGKPKEAMTLMSKESDEEIKKLKADTTEKNKFHLGAAMAGGTFAGIPGAVMGSAGAADITEALNERFIPKGLESKKSSGGFKRVLGGIADFVTGGMFDFDQRNREGAPKDFGIRRIAGGLADWATMGLTDFDKRGAGNLQFNPIFGGKDKAWGSRNEQAKRREKQSGFGLKRGIGGLLDFATLGMFDFDKQNRRGAPKGFGIKRIMGGVADWATMGLTDFDQRGAGLFQFNPIGGGKDKAWGKEYETPQRILDHRDKVNKLRNMSQFATKDGRTISMYDMLTSGDRSQIEEALYMQRVKERGSSEGHSDWIGNPKYEAETLKYLKPSSTNETPLKLGKQPVKFDEELLGVSASYETDGGQKEFIVYAPTTQINMLPGDNSGQLVTSGAIASSGDDPYEILEKGN